LIFGVAELIAYLSRSTTLYPGDLILTGTPAGIGNARSPKIFLNDGDTVTVSISSIGSLTNPVAELVPAGLAR
jgi:2-keto-4-pentenoate hydratase/2-oxohepta-3-ene-1,7-dioic acid hydratase in catechol pathway